MQGGELWIWDEQKKKWYKSVQRTLSRKKRSVATEFKAKPTTKASLSLAQKVAQGIATRKEEQEYWAQQAATQNR